MSVFPQSTVHGKYETTIWLRHLKSFLTVNNYFKAFLGHWPLKIGPFSNVLCNGKILCCWNMWNYFSVKDEANQPLISKIRSYLLMERAVKDYNLVKVFEKSFHVFSSKNGLQRARKNGPIKWPLTKISQNLRLMNSWFFSDFWQLERLWEVFSTLVVLRSIFAGHQKLLRNENDPKRTTG